MESAEEPPQGPVAVPAPAAAAAAAQPQEQPETPAAPSAAAPQQWQDHSDTAAAAAAADGEHAGGPSAVGNPGEAAAATPLAALAPVADPAAAADDARDAPPAAASPPPTAADGMDTGAPTAADDAAAPADPAAAPPPAAAVEASPRPQATAVQRLLIPLRAQGGGAASEAARLAFAVVDQRKKLAGYIEELGGALPEGWQAAVKVRKVGSSAGSLDTTFIGPTGKKYRSKGDVARALGLTVPSPNAAAGSAPGGAEEEGGEGEEEGTPGPGSSSPPVAPSPVAPKPSPLPGGRWRTKRASAAGAAKAVAAAKAAGERGEDEGVSEDEEDAYAPTAEDDGDPPSPREGRGGVIKPDPILSREEAIERAVLKGEQLRAAGVTIPLKLPTGVVVESLGLIDMRPSFCSLPNIWPVGYRAVFRDPHAGLFVSEIGVEPGKTRCQFTVSLVPKTSSSPRGATSAAAAAEQTGGGAAAAAEGAAPSILLATARSPDAVWQAVVSLQTKLQSGAVSASVPTADGVPPEALSLLQKALSLKKCWGRAMYGFAEVKVLQLIEAMPGAGELSGYKFADQRGGWAQEAEVLRRGKWAKRSTIAEPLRHGSTPGASGSGGVGSSSKAKPEKAAPGSGGGKGRAPAAAAAAAGQQVQPGLERFRESALWHHMSAEEQQDWMGVEATMNQALKKMEVWEIVQNSKARRASGSAAAGAEAEVAAAASAEEGDGHTQASPSKKTFKGLTARQVLLKVFPHPKAPATGAGGMGLGAAGAAAAGGGVEGGLGSRCNTGSLTLHSQLSLAALEDLELPGAANMQLPGGAAALQHLSGEQAADLVQIWQFCCRFGSVIDLSEVPSLKQLEQGLLGVVSHSGLTAAGLQAVQSAGGAVALTGAGSGAAAPAAAEADDPHAAAEAGQDACAAGEQQVEVAPATAPLLKEGSGPLSAAAVGAPGHRTSSSQAADSATAAGEAWVGLHVALLELLVGDAYEAVSTAEVLELKPLEQRLAAPKVTLATWPEAARRYLVAAATALYLSAGETKSSAADAKKKTFELPGVLSALEAADWAQHLCGGLNAPYLLSRVALLPQNSSDTAAESLSSLDDAAALAAAERTLQHLAAAASGCTGSSSSSQEAHTTPASGAAAAAGGIGHGSKEQQQQALVARRLIQALVDVRYERGRKASGARMCFCAQELGPLAGWTTGLDLHTIAARLQSGLYAATQQPMASLAADLALMCDMWRAAFNNEDDQVAGFDGADATLADAVEERLQELMAAVEAGDDLRSVVNAHVVYNPEWLMPVPPPEALPAAAAAAAGSAGPGEGMPALPAPTGAASALPAAAAVADKACAKEEVQLAPLALNGHATAAPAANGVHPGPSSSSSPMDVDSPAAGVVSKAPPAASGVKQEAPGTEDAHVLQEDKKQIVPQQQQQQQQQEEDTELVYDPHNLLKAGRPFNPLAGCKVCWRETDEASLLLCDSCNDEYHCYCVTPQLLAVPEGDWYCPVCSASSAAHPVALPPAAPAAAAEPGAALLEATRQAGAVSLSPSARLAPVRQAWGLLETAEMLTRVPYGSWPAAARLRLLTQLCELAWSTTPMLEYWEQQNEVRREAQKQLYDSRMKLSRARKAAAAEAKRVADEARAAAAAAATQAALAAAAAAGLNGAVPGGAEAAAGGDAGAAAAAAAADGGEQGDVEMQDAEGEEAAAAAAAAAGDGGLQQALSGVGPEAGDASLPPLPPPKAGKGKGKKGGGKKGGKGAAAKQSAAAEAANTAAADTPAAAAAAAAPAPAAPVEIVDEVQELLLMAEQQRLLEVTALRSSCLGTDRWHNRYWCLGASQLPHAAAKAAGGGSKTKKSGRGVSGAGVNGIGHPGWLFMEVSEQYLQHQAATAPAAADTGLPSTAASAGPLLLSAGSSSCPSNISSSQAAAGAALDSVGPDEPAAGAVWVQFTTIAELDAIMRQLNGAGLRERVLLDALHRLREAWLLFAPDPDPAEAAAAPAVGPGDVEAAAGVEGVAGGPEQPAGAEGAAEQQQQQQQQQQHPSAATQDAAAAAAAAAGDVDMDHAPQPAAAAAAAGTVTPEVSAAASFAELQQAAAAAEAAAAVPQLRARFLRLLSSFPDASFQPFWGSKQRREAWEAALAAADTPGAFVSLLGVLQTMLLQDSFRGVWRLWATPVQQQEVVHTWPGVWYRLLAFESTKKPILPTKEQRLRAQEAVWKARKAEAAAAAAARAAARAEAEQQAAAAAAAAAAGADASAAAAADKAGVKKRGRTDASGGAAAPAAAAGSKGGSTKQGVAGPAGRRIGDSSGGSSEASEEEQEGRPQAKKQKAMAKGGKATAAAAAAEKGGSKGKGKQKAAAAAGKSGKSAVATKAAAAAAAKSKLLGSMGSGSDSDFVASDAEAEEEDEDQGSSSDSEAAGKQRRRAASDDEDSAVSTGDEEGSEEAGSTSDDSDDDAESGGKGNVAAAKKARGKVGSSSKQAGAKGKAPVAKAAAGGKPGGSKAAATKGGSSQPPRSQQQQRGKRPAPQADSDTSTEAAPSHPPPKKKSKAASAQAAAAGASGSAAGRNSAKAPQKRAAAAAAPATGGGSSGGSKRGDAGSSSRAAGRQQQQEGSRRASYTGTGKAKGLSAAGGAGKQKVVEVGKERAAAAGGGSRAARTGKGGAAAVDPKRASRGVAEWSDDD